MGKKKPTKGEPPKTCQGCRSFKPGKRGGGFCTRKEKKRSAHNEACGSFKAR